MRPKPFRLFSRAAMTLLLALFTAQTAWAQGNYWLNVEPNYEGGSAVAIPVNYDYINDGYQYALNAAYFEAQFNRPGDHHIICFSTQPDGGDIYFPGETITLTTNPTTLYAQWDIPWSGSGTASGPYMIYTKEQLLLLAYRVNGTYGETAVEDGYSGKYFKLGADIAFPHADNEGEEYTENYEAIGMFDGTNDRYFKGDFDGGGHTVSGIRIRKTGTGWADRLQGLFGQTRNANIHDVHLTDARIIGYQDVGGIVGGNFESTVSGCTVTGSYITADRDFGTICGYNGYATLTNNYYHGCTVNGTAVTSGKGCNGADITANNGALPAYRLDLGANITTPPGTFVGQTEWLDTPPVSPRLAPENGFTLAGNHYFASGYVFTPGSTLASGAAQGYTPRATLGDQLLDLYTPTGDADPLAGKAIARLTITADCDGKTLASTQAIYSTGQPVTVAYINADGTPAQTQAIALDGYEAVDGDGDVCLDEGTYYVGTDITYANRIYLYGNITLILADGKTMTLASDVTGIAGSNLTIYGQSLDDATAGTLRYDGKSHGILVNNYEQHSGNVSITTTGSGVWGITANVTLQGGTLAISVDGTGARAIYGRTLSILGGQLTANATGTNATGIYAVASSGTAITLGWTNPTDRITASSISVPGGGTVAVADGQALTDGSGNIYTGTLTASVLSAFAAETTLQPCLALADAADNTAAITDHAGQTLAVALSGRTLYKDGSWNTLCLPFDVTVSGSVLDGTGVEVKTLTSSDFAAAGGTLTLNFSETSVATLTAGVPYIIRWTKPANYVAYDGTNAAECSDLVNPAFAGVTVSSTTHPVETVWVDFIGIYSPTVIYEESTEKHNLYLGTGDLLYFPTAVGLTVNACRGYFRLKNGLTAGEDASGVRAFVLNFGDETTGIVSAEANSSLFTLHSSLSEWYTPDGRKLSGKPTRRGLYIHNGKRIVVK